jgi:hypothetical protein
MSGLPYPATPPELTALEAALGDLVLRPAGVDRDAVLFRAGQAAAPRRWLWPCATVAASAAAVVLGVLLALRPAPEVRERIVYVPAPAPTAPEHTQGADHRALTQPGSPQQGADAPRSPDADTSAPVYSSPQRRLEEHLLRWGLDGLGDPGPDPEPPARSGELLSHFYSSMGD